MPALKEDPHYQAQSILAIRDHAEHELRMKLKKKGFSASEIDGAVLSLKESNLINDAVFAEAFIENTIRFKAVGKRWLFSKLRQKGVASELIEQALEKILDPETEERLLQEAKASWKKQHAESASPDKLQRFLASRGFSPFS